MVGVGERDGFDCLVPPYKGYPPEIYEFYRLAQQERWKDYDCHPDEANGMMADPELVASATIDQFKTMITGCVGGESIWKGDWGEQLCTGTVAALLRRLKELRDTIP